MPSDTGSVRTETWTHSHLARKKLFLCRTITRETSSIFRPGSKSRTSHCVPVSFSFFVSRISVLGSISTLSFITYISVKVSLIYQFMFCISHIHLPLVEIVRYSVVILLCQHYTMELNAILFGVFKALKMAFEKLNNNVSSPKQCPDNSG